jgi:hypothetical protein
MFKIILHAEWNVTPVFLSFAIEANPEHAVAMRVETLQESELEDRRENIRKRIQALGNLLEIQPGGYSTQSYVRVMHLTVKEFLLRADVQCKLTSNTTNSALDTNVALISTCLIIIKSTRCQWHHDRRDLVEQAVTYAAQAENTTGLPQTRLLDNLNATMEIVSAPDPDLPFVRRSNRLHWNDWEQTDGECDCHDDFMSLAVDANLTLYVQQELENGYDLAAKPGRPLLAYAMIPKRRRWLRPDFSNASMIRLLLHHHANPNAIIESECRCSGTTSGNTDYWPSRPSIWQMALALGMEYVVSEPRPYYWAEMVKTLLDHGASPTETIWWDLTHGKSSRGPVQQSALFVCLYRSVKYPSCHFLPSLLISKGGSLLPDELKFLGHYGRTGSRPPKFERRYAWVRSVSRLVRALEEALECSTSTHSSIGFSEREELQKDWKRVSGAGS